MKLVILLALCAVAAAAPKANRDAFGIGNKFIRLNTSLFSYLCVVYRKFHGKCPEELFEMVPSSPATGANCIHNI